MGSTCGYIGESGTVSLLSSVADAQGVIHSIWARSFLSDDGSLKAAMEYARWDGNRWTRPEAIISPLSGVPLQISFTIDSQERLLISWVDGGSGDLLFSWANSEGANLASNWEAPSGLPSPSKLISSPDIVIDGTGKIVVVYAIPLMKAGEYTLFNQLIAVRVGLHQFVCSMQLQLVGKKQVIQK